MPGGRPPKFDSPEKLQEAIDAYFTETSEDEWTMTGLAMALDFDYQTLINYGKKEGYEKFFESIKNAKMKVHNVYEKDLRKKGRSGDIFALKNFGWRDKQEVEQETTGSLKISWGE